MLRNVQPAPQGPAAPNLSSVFTIRIHIQGLLFLAAFRVATTVAWAIQGECV
jgi:hypothetical protein